MLTEAEKASIRAKDLTSQLLSFSEGSSPVKKIVYLQELAKDLLTLAGDGKAMKVETTLPDNLWPVEVDESQAGQDQVRHSWDAIAFLPADSLHGQRNNGCE